jgi:hypothetical protein
MPNIFVVQVNASAPSNTLVLSSSDAVVAANVDRVGLVLTNISSSTVYLALAGRVAVLNKGIILTPNGGTWTMDEYTFNNEKVSAIANTTNSVLAVQEFVR